MVTIGRTVSAFSLMVVIGYLMVVALTPPPIASDWHPGDEMSDTSAAARLSQEARTLVSHKPAASLQ